MVDTSVPRVQEYLTRTAKDTMKVRELVALLQAQDQEREVLSGDNDDWYYDIDTVVVEGVVDGRVDEDGEKCVLIRGY